MKKTITHTIQKIMLICGTSILLSNNIHAQAFTEGFDTTANLIAAGWDTINLSNAQGTESWLQGYSSLINQTGRFQAHSGDTTSFISVNFNSGTATATLSNWLLTPARTISNGDTLSFWTRATSVGAGVVYPDRMQVRMSSVNSSNVGTSETSVGDFTTLLLDINPTYTTTDYPLVWTQYNLVVSGLSSPVTGRFAFRYFVEMGGPSGANSFTIGLDDVKYVPHAVGINSIPFQAIKLLVYPNPTTDMITVDMGLSLQSNAIVSVENELGQVISNGSMNKGTQSQILNVSGYAAGHYTIRIVDNDHHLFQATFQKN
jgi:hypothetical protein